MTSMSYYISISSDSISNERHISKLLAEYNVPLINYSPEELDEDKNNAQSCPLADGTQAI